MLFYEARMSYKCDQDSKINLLEVNPKKVWGDMIIQDMNEMLAEKAGKDKIEMIICEAKKEKFVLIAATDSLEKITAESLSKIFMKRLSDYEISSVKVLSLNEIIPAVAAKLLRQAERNDYTTYHCDWERQGIGENEDFSLRYYRNGTFSIEEKLISDKKLSHESAKKSAEALMTDKSFLEELERIYSDKNPKEFFWHPVHYKIVAKNSQGALQMANLLCQALYSNKRLVSRCMSFISEISEDCYNESDIANIFRQSAGGTIIMNFAARVRSIKIMRRATKKLFKIFAENFFLCYNQKNF